MLGTNLGVHIDRAPSGKWGFVGSLPHCLGDEVKADKAALIGGRAFEGENGEYLMLKFPWFATESEARDHAESRGVRVHN